MYDSQTSSIQRSRYRKTPPLRRIDFGIYFSYETDFYLKIEGRLEGGVLLNSIKEKTISKYFSYKTNFYLKVGGRLKGGVVLKDGFYGSWKCIHT